jgi:hypothetical protein
MIYENKHNQFNIEPTKNNSSKKNTKISWNKKIEIKKRMSKILKGKHWYDI